MSDDQGRHAWRRTGDAVSRRNGKQRGAAGLAAVAARRGASPPGESAADTVAPFRGSVDGGSDATRHGGTGTQERTIRVPAGRAPRSRPSGLPTAISPHCLESWVGVHVRPTHPSGGLSRGLPPRMGLVVCVLATPRTAAVHTRPGCRPKRARHPPEGGATTRKVGPGKTRPAGTLPSNMVGARATHNAATARGSRSAQHPPNSPACQELRLPPTPDATRNPIVPCSGQAPAGP
jgi:hypothetical protein